MVRELRKEELLYELDEVAMSVMKEAINRDYEEDTITQNLLTDIAKIFTSDNERRRLNGLKIFMNKYLYKYVSLEAYKFRGQAEKDFGDILGLISLGMNETVYIGMFSLEAKIVDKDKIKSFRYKQLAHLLGNNIYTRWVVYNLDDEEVYVINPQILSHCEHEKPKFESISTFSLYLSDYIVNFLLNGYDSFLFIKDKGDYKPIPTHSNLSHISSLRDITEFFIEKYNKFSLREAPTYILTAGLATNNEAFEKSINVLKELLYELENYLSKKYEALHIDKLYEDRPNNNPPATGL